MNEEKQTEKRVNFSKLISKKNTLVIILVLAFLGSMAYMQIGSSKHERYDTTQSQVAFESNPKPFPLTSTNSANSTGGFNVSSGFNNLPGFNVPANLIGDYPASFGNGSFGGLPDLGNGGPNVGGGGTSPPLDIPPLDTPTPPDAGGIQNPGGAGSGVGSPGSGTNFTPPDLNGQNNTSTGNGTQVFNPTSDKARNLPKLKFLNFGGINLNFINLGQLIPLNDFGAISYIFILLSAVFLNGNFIPMFFKRLEDLEHSGSENESIFFVPKKRIEDEKKRKERIRRLMVFKDHVDELIERSKTRIEDHTASQTIVVGYHELDHAFSEFANLIRTKDITPLEHAHSHFEEGEISAEILEKIVALFYLSRYGRRDLEKKYGFLFIDLLENLVTANPEFLSKLEGLTNSLAL